MQPNFRIRNKDIEKLTKLNRSTQRKQNRLNRLFDVTINKPLLKIDQFNTRKEFNKYVKDLESFTSYGSHRYVKNAKGVVIKRELYTDINREVRKLNKENKKNLESWTKRSHTDRGESTGWSVEDAIYKMGDPRMNRFRPRKFNFDVFTHEGAIRDYLTRIRRQNDPKYVERSDKQLRKNYLNALGVIFDEDSKPIISAIRKMTMQKFLLTFYTENVADFDFLYSFQSRIIKLIELHKIWGVPSNLTQFLESLL